VEELYWGPWRSSKARFSAKYFGPYFPWLFSRKHPQELRIGSYQVQKDECKKLNSNLYFRHIVNLPILYNIDEAETFDVARIHWPVVPMFCNDAGWVLGIPEIHWFHHWRWRSPREDWGRTKRRGWRWRRKGQRCQGQKEEVISFALCLMLNQLFYNACFIFNYF